MSLASRQLDIGAHVSTDYDHGRQSIHSIVARRLDAGSTSGVVFRVLPDLGGWIDADWFEPVTGFEERHDGLYNAERDDSSEWTW